MEADSFAYLRLKLAIDGELSIEDAKEVLSALSESAQKQFKLVIKSETSSGVQFYLASSKDNLDTLKHHIYSVCPSVTIEEVKRSEVVLSRPDSTLILKFKNHFAYPFFNPKKADNEALFKTLSRVNSLKNSEQVVISLTSAAAHPIRAIFIRRRLLNGYMPYLNDKTLKGYIAKLFFLLFYVLSSALKAVILLANNLSTKPNTHHARLQRQKVDHEESVLLLDKLYEPLFKTRLVVDIKAGKRRLTKIKKEALLALTNFTGSCGDQQLVVKNNPGSRDIYSLSDLAAWLNFTKSDLKSGIYDAQHFKTLPIPKSFKSKKQPGDIVIGLNTYQGSMREIILPKSARYRHTYITGATGSGKSTLLANLISQDIANGQGATLIDPHGDLASEVMRNIPGKRQKDVIYFDPSSPKTSLSINLLETNYAPGTENYTHEVEMLTEGVISLFRKVFMVEDVSSHRLEYILRNSIRTALEIPGSNIFTIFKLLTDSGFRLDVTNQLKDINLINFWRNELGRAGEYQRVKMTSGVTSKIGRFLFSEPTKRVFGQTKSSLDLRDVMDSNRILICNFSKGKLGEDGSKLFATAILTKIQLAALSRADTAAAYRKDHFVYVDEFQNYAPSVLIQMLSELRKYGLYLAMAEQSPSQQDSLSTNIVLANIGNLICFRTASPKDADLLLPSFSSYLNATDLSNLPAYNFYLKSVGEIVAPPTSGQTIPPANKKNVSLKNAASRSKPELSQLLEARAT